MKNLLFKIAILLIFAISCSKEDEPILPPTPTAVETTNIYVAGFESNGLVNVANYWKNGVANSLSDGIKSTEVHSIFVFNNDVFTAGYHIMG